MKYLVTVKFDYIIETNETIAELNEMLTARIKHMYNPRKMMIMIDELPFALAREERMAKQQHDPHNHEENCCPENLE